MCFFLQQGFSTKSIFRKFKIFILLIVAFLLLQGCSIFHPEYLKTDPDGYLVKHMNACGPEALEKAFYRLSLKDKSTLPLDRYRLSKDIQDTGNTLRYTLSLIHYEAIIITFPSEVKKVAKKYGYEIIEVDSLDELDALNDVALILVWGNRLIRDQAHWLVYPDDKWRVKSFFGSKTKISDILVFKKKSEQPLSRR